MRILLLNPNTSEGLTDLLCAAARQVAAPGTEIHPVTAEFGVPYISTRTEAAVGALAALEILAERHHEFDGAILAAFGDPGLGAVRELYDLPVVGLAEAGMLTACMLGGRFAVVTFAQALGPWYRECIRWHRLEARCAGIRMLEEPFQSITDVQAEKEERLIQLALHAVREDGADVIVLAGAPLAGLARSVRDRIPVPVVDCAQAAVKQIEALVTLGPAPPREGSFRRPVPKSSRGLSPALARRVAGDAGG